MAESRRHHQILLQVVDRKPMPQPYPWVSYRSRDELRAAVVRATRVYWSAARRVDVTLAGSDWRECRGEVFLAFPIGLTDGVCRLCIIRAREAASLREDAT